MRAATRASQSAIGPTPRNRHPCFRGEAVFAVAIPSTPLVVEVAYI
jgi:hypothetical protein